MHQLFSEKVKQTRKVATFLLVSILNSPVVASPNVDELLGHVDELWRGHSSHTLMSMTVSTQHYQRTMNLEGWSYGQEKALVVIKSPKKDKGIATLKSDKNVWNYLPKINRVTKVPSSMMSGSWMGSHFTNDDLVKDSTFREDYSSALTFDGTRQGKAIFELTLIPHKNAPVVWGKVIIIVQQQDYIPQEVLYFDEDFALKRTMEFADARLVGSKVIPHKLILTPTDKPSESTIIEYQIIDFDVHVDERFFSLQNLKKKRL